MFVSLLRSFTRLTTRCRRYCSCWCPEEPIDPNTRITYLPNGVRVMTEQNNSPLACVSLCIIAGPRYETANCNGLTHFIEHMAYKGFHSMKKSYFEENVYMNGAKMFAKTRRDMQIFSVLIPAERVADGVIYLSKILLELALDVSEMDRERYNMCLEAIDSDNNPKQTVFDYLHATAFQGTSLAQPVIGPLRNLAKFDQSTTAAFMCEHYSTCRLVVATSGGVHNDQVLGAVGGTFGALCPTGVGDADTGPQRFTGSEAVYRDDSMPLCHVTIGFEAPGYNSFHYYTMLVMKYIIGSWHASQGRPENQPFLTALGASSMKCDSYQSFYIPYKDVGLWGAYFVVDKLHVDDMVFLIQDAWMQMCVMCNSFEIVKARNLAKLEVARQHCGVLNSCRDMGIQMMYACRRHSLPLMLNQVEIVQPFMVKEMGMQCLYNRSPAVAAVGPSECLPEYNRTQAGMYWLRW